MQLYLIKCKHCGEEYRDGYDDHHCRKDFLMGEKHKSDIELWLLRLKTEPEKWTVDQAMKSIFQ